MAAGLLALGLLAPSAHAERCDASGPAINKTGFRPATTVFYDVAPSPDGTPFPGRMRECLDRAFDAWTTANAWAGSWVRFVPGPGGVVVRFDVEGGLVLRRGRAGAWTDAARAPDGYLDAANVWLTRDPDILTTCRGVTKVMLHELGHLHGLADVRTPGVRSVMNPLGGTDDHDQLVPLAPTRCDAAQAAAASAVAVAPRRAGAGNRARR